MTDWFDPGAAAQAEVSIDHFLGAARGTQANSVIVPASGNALINGLLSGVKWSTTTLTIAAVANPSAYGPPPYNGGSGEPATHSVVTAAQVNVFNWAIRLIEDYTTIDFVAGNETNANIRVANVSGQSHAYYPTGIDAMGDVWMGDMNNMAGFLITDPKQGDFNFATHLHELGHALGLKHGQDVGGPQQQANGTPIPQYAPLPTAFDNWNWSLMTYRSYTGAGLNPVQGNMQSDNPITYMPADIAALQYMYGAEFNGTSSTDTVYRWNNQGFFSMNAVLPAELNGQPAANGKMLMTVWDGGGNDTYDFSLFSGNQIISLVPGAFSTFNTAQLADLDRSPTVRLALGNVANAFLFNNDLRSLIENAIAGTGNDIITGNQGNNNLQGNNGNDTLSGGAGTDTLNGGPGNDIYNLGSEVANDTITDASGRDTVFTLVTRTLVWAGVEDMILQGTANINGTGNNFANGIAGNSGNNVLAGLDGDDSLEAAGGNDYLFGQGGQDSLIGGAGQDRFVLQNASQSVAGPTCDYIRDFDHNGDDVLDLGGVVPGTLTYIGVAQFNAVNQVRIHDIAGPNMVVAINLDNDQPPEAQILLLSTTLGNGVAQVAADDFIL